MRSINSWGVDHFDAISGVRAFPGASSSAKSPNQRAGLAP